MEMIFLFYINDLSLIVIQITLSMDTSAGLVLHGCVSLQWML